MLIIFQKFKQIFVLENIYIFWKLFLKIVFWELFSKSFQTNPIFFSILGKQHTLAFAISLCTKMILKLHFWLIIIFLIIFSTAINGVGFLNALKIKWKWTHAWIHVKLLSVFYLTLSFPFPLIREKWNRPTIEKFCMWRNLLSIHSSHDKGVVPRFASNAFLISSKGWLPT